MNECKPYGYDVTVEIRTGGAGTVEKVFHKMGTEAQVRRWGMLKPCAKRIVKMEPLTREQYIRAYGDHNAPKFS